MPGPSHGATTPVAECVDLTKRFGPVTAVDALTVAFDAPATGLLGANGAGKTTLMRLFLGLSAPDSGRASVLGAPPGAPASRRRLGFMPEHDALPLDMTARDYVVHLAEVRGLPRREAALRGSEVLFGVGLTEERSRLMSTYSTGMKQRSKLAQAIVHSPELVFLDEPTAGLDPDGRAAMLDLVRRVSREFGIRVIVSSHVLDDIERTCDAVVILDGGRLARSERLDGLDRGGSGELHVRVRARDPHATERFVATLAERGLAVVDGPDGVLVARDLPGDGFDAAFDAVRDAAAQTGVELRLLRRRARTLEDAVIEDFGAPATRVPEPALLVSE